MNNHERIVIYGGLVLLLGLSIAALSDGSRAAVADVGQTATPLGPAQTLSLVENGRELLLRNRDGRLAWDDNDYARAYSIAFVHIGRAIGPLLEAEEYVEEYQRLDAEVREKDEEIAQRIFEFREEHKDVAPDDPDAGQIQQAFQLLLQEREQWRIEGTRQLGQLAADQVERAYRDLIAAVEVVAERRRIDLVYRFIPTGNEFMAANPPQAYTGIRARIALKYPESLDITDAVMEELALEVE